ncbi:leucyl aminopeptidase family protein [Tunicatimonas pelagia]|uniref:leucyl aminopeptidase family protein n=1 Tax=Tunicatimonas pelagia TaxID=931531 RepID=UPI002666AAB3|nr:leucyl aminopeptidase [Tunicatimonas pelagia]WKN44467.1 leucyl aminopeptidase [Tunicatimonas pelagia]
MSIKLKTAKAIKDKDDLIVLLSDGEPDGDLLTNEAERHYFQRKLKSKKELIAINQYQRWVFLVAPITEDSPEYTVEAYRKQGASLYKRLKQEEVKKVKISGGQASQVLALAEGLLLAAYTFSSYRKELKEVVASGLKEVSIVHPEISSRDVQELGNIVAGTCLARDLINEPVISLNANQLSKAFKKAGKESGFKVEVFDKPRIKSLKMGGLLGVNAGSEDPPTFNILEYKSDNPVNAQPYVIVGKGVTYDTGGLSLKPSTSMDTMKSDMGGSAAVIGTMVAVAKNKLPIHLIGLVPATDNRPGGNAIVPGDVITISDGTTVEVLNTDAEGRLILADALAFAKKYKPALVIDLATLTGAAAVAIGKEGMVMMGSASEEYKNQLRQAGEETYERLVEFPLWKEYRSYLKSDIADLKNIGGRMAGAITAGMFLKHFTDYEWMHLDIAGVAFLDSPDGYRGKNGTGAGVRLLYHFFKKLAQ